MSQTSSPNTINPIDDPLNSINSCFLEFLKIQLRKLVKKKIKKKNFKKNFKKNNFSNPFFFEK